MSDKKTSKHSGAGLWIILVAAVVLETISCLQYFTSRAAIRRETMKRVEIELHQAELEINVVTIEMEAAAKMLTTLAERHIDNPDSIANATRTLLQTIENVSSAGVACQPYLFPDKGKWYEVCSSRDTCNGEPCIYTRQIGGAHHDYLQTQWYHDGLTIDSCWWSEPYYDNNGAKDMIVSCTHPIRNKQGEIVAVTCIDLSLNYLQRVSQYLKVYKESYFSIYSNAGMKIVSDDDTIPGRKYQIYKEEVGKTGWMLTIVIPEDVMFADLNRVGTYVIILMLLGLGLLVLIVWYAGTNIRRLMESTARNQLMENELQIARSIQMAMLPTRFPPFPDYPNLNAHGVVIPAKEVGGDLFDFYIRDNKLHFCIGDVSGKGVPAALVMAVTRSLFRSVTSYMDSPAQIVSQMNNSVSGDSNDQNMFITLFVGVLDLSTGTLRYCNAGHDAPIVIEHLHQGADTCTRAVSLPVEANLPLGVLAGYAYSEQTTILNIGDTFFLYTDGLNEAENSNHEQFGEQRIFETINQWHTEMTTEEQIADMKAAVDRFVGQAEQSDDLTMFAVQLLEMNDPTGHTKAQSSKHYSLVMRNDIQQIPTLAQWIELIGVPDALNMPINLALEEAVSNVMLYAYPDNGTPHSGQVLVEAEKTPGKIVFTISDSGIPFDPTKKENADITLSVEERAIGGLGIHLVRQIMDDIHYERKDNKNILTLLKNL